MLLNNELEITLPDGFHILTEEELAGMNFSDGKPDLCISDPERHIIISIAWRKSGFAAHLLSAKDVIGKMESGIRKSMEPYGYSLETFLTEDMNGTPAEGFRYEYEAQGISMIGETFSVRKGKVFYYIHCYLRKALREESLQTLESFFGTFRWS